MERHRLAQLLPWIACLTWAGTVLGVGRFAAGYSQLRHPLAALGAHGAPHATAFNLLGYVLPGLLLAWQAWRWRSGSTAAGWRLRIGLQLVLLSALAFAAQGLLPLDPRDLAAPASRLHALAWMAWWTAFVPGALLTAGGMRAGIASAAALVLAVLVPVLVLSGGILLPPALAQRAAVVLWLLWWPATARVAAKPAAKIGFR